MLSQKNKPNLARPETGPNQWFRPTPAVDFDSVCGMEDLKHRLRAAIDHLSHPIWEKLFANQPSPAYLFYGPPGSGKSHCISAFVHGFMEQGYRYMQVGPGDIQSRLVGESEKNLEQVFRTAMDAAPCVLVISDVDRLCRDRTNPLLPFYHVNLTNAFLAGFRQMQNSGRKVVFIGETSAPWDLDLALMDWSQLLRLPDPDENTRAQYLRQQLSPTLLDTDPLMKMLLDATVNTSFRYMGRLIHGIQSQMRGQMARNTSDSLSYEEQERLFRSAVSTGQIRPTQAMLEKTLEENPLNYSPYIRKPDEFEMSLRTFTKF